MAARLDGLEVLESTDDTEIIDESAIQNLRSSISQFSFSFASPRRSPRKLSRPTESDSNGAHTLPVTPRKRRAALDVSTARTPSPKKSKRGYAAPEMYAHLNFLQDYLKEELDVMFCGINPGYMSAEKGHHFANPTNHFWKCLHQSGFTPSLIPPTRDFTLPSSYNIGLTNLVDRPSIEQAELSPAEMATSVPAFLSKVARWRPRIVCFVGRGIWLCVEKALQQPLGTSARPKPPSSPRKKTRKGKDEGYGLQPYKAVHPSADRDEISTVRETLFFVVPSTSGRVVSHQLPDKVRLFTTLHDVVDQMKSGALDTDSMAVVELLKDEEMPEVPLDRLPSALLVMDDDVKAEESA